ncbi:hypothetical protein [Wolbachia endosymbiont of Dirofilaria (Dirofilaria) immitis]|uniref:hypothetical protein n=1 Tax=Wolbachia endosymbiont of Dirofilaria (Dirofilaria) immitis TaxID=1812115 RepID=UPI00158C5853|nr:hypothetical protein [Wolbachia endosymbiont of Dirofilaria (Dirofilaria) immitis]QKX02555.1 hypothetical protein GOY12_03335 [Wolbachia endosymbiont of Dirofilaria (Dirofilaria) immitis]
MNKENNEIVKPTSSTPQETEKINEPRVQNVLSQKKYKINFDDRKYAVKIIKTQFTKIEQQPLKPKGFLKSIPVIGKLLAKIFTSEGETYKLRLQTDHFSKAKNETCINNKYTEGVGSKLKKSNVEQVDKEEKNINIDHLKF